MSQRTYASLFYHLVWGTKNRVPYIFTDIKKPLYEYIGRVVDRKGWCLLAIGGVSDHVHILVQTNCHTYPVSELVCRIKSNTSKFMRDNFDSNFTWQRGYSVFSSDIKACTAIKNYILKQEEHHKDISFEKEFELLLKRYNIKYDEKDKKSFFE